MKVFIVMGVTGCGKTTVGKLLAKRLNCFFYDGDDFHPEENVEKMNNGQPLTTEDRIPWLQAIKILAEEHIDQDARCVIACSALKSEYRTKYLRVSNDVTFIYLKGSKELISSRLAARTGHFMDPELLDSQFEALEEPKKAIVVDVTAEPAQIVETLLAKL